MKSNLRDLFRELEQKTLAQNSLAAYASYALDLVPAAHHTLICDHIDQLLQDEFDELIILAPPGSAKSTYTSIALPAYFIGKYPDQQILTCSYSSELAEKWGRRVRNQIMTPVHRSLFPNCILSKDSMAAGRWSTTLDGALYASGVGSGILGFRADLGVIDDPISGFEQAQSETQLRKVMGWYETDFITRLKPKGKIVLICQRLARNDLAGYLIDRNVISPTRRQRLLKLKMVAEPDQLDPLGRAPGERLWPEWFTAQQVQDAQRDEYKWKTLYQQEPPSDEGDWVAPENIQITPSIPVPEADLRYYVLTDLALSVAGGDYTVHLVAAVDKDTNIFVVQALRFRQAIDYTARVHLELISNYRPLECLIDDDNMAKVYSQLLARMARELNVPVPFKPLPLRGQDKETRAAPIRGWFRRGKVFLLEGPWNSWFSQQLLRFPHATEDGGDDGVDAIGLLGRRLMSLYGRGVESTTPTQDRPDPDRLCLENLYASSRNLKLVRPRI